MTPWIYLVLGLLLWLAVAYYVGARLGAWLRSQDNEDEREEEEERWAA